MESDLELADDSERRYKTNFLMRVIFRIDFTKALEDSKIKRSKFENGIREIFKTPEIQKLKVLEATISDKLTASKVEDVDSYVFLDEKKVRKLTVTPNGINFGIN